MTNTIGVISLSLVGLSIVLCLIYLAILLIKRRRRMKTIPPNLLEDFEYAEQKLQDSKGEVTPYEILWEIANSQSNLKGGMNYGRKAEPYPRTTGTLIGTEQRTGNREVLQLPSGRKDLQGDYPPSSSEIGSRIERPERSHRRSIFRRRIRR